MTSLCIAPGSRVLFQGDSITDAGRDRNDDSLLGNGYANLIAAWLTARYPSHNLSFINRGISGNRIYDMEERWSEDCIDLQPDVVSILIGINDTWRFYDSNTLSPFNEFEDCYRRLLERVKKETTAKVIIMEPFVLPVPEDRIVWREDLDPRIDAIRRVAREFNCQYLPCDGIFAAASTQRNCAVWAADGVHPSQAGHALMAQAWIAAMGGI